MDYIELTLHLTPREPWTEIAIARLAENGYDGFMETETGVLAYAPVSSFEEDVLNDLLEFPQDVVISCSFQRIEQQNWNAEWEAGFDPVEVGDELVILAPFHDQLPYNQTHKIIIQPQMSFGTGHHQTTFMMCSYLLKHPPVDLSVLDVGTGTGVLAILAHQLGSKYCVGTEIEPWSVENSKENALRNSIDTIEFIEGDIDCVKGQQFDLILANINKNVLKSHLQSYYELLTAHGKLVLSGFFESDKNELVAFAEAQNFEFIAHNTKETWCSLEFKVK